MKRKILSMAIMLSLFLGIAAMPTAAEGTQNDLLLGTGDFEATNENIVWNLGMDVVTDADGGAKSGVSYLAVPEGATEDTVYGASVTIPVQPDTGYTLSFWVRCGSTESGRVLIRSFADGVQYSQADTSHSILGGDITVRFGSIVPNGETVSPWREVKKSFITAPETDSLLLQFYTQYNDGYSDLKMCLDSIKLTEGVENLLMNGEMNAYEGVTRNDEKNEQPDYVIVPMPDLWYIRVVNGGGWNRVWENTEISGNGNTVYELGKYSQLFQRVLLKAGQYKMSFRYFSYNDMPPTGGCILSENYSFYGEDGGICPCFRQNIGAAVPNQGFQKWMEYSTYFTVPADGEYAIGIGDRYSQSGKFYDDIKLLPAEENTVTYVNPTYASVADPEGGYSTIGNISSMCGNVVDTISGGTQASGAYNLTAIGHYLAKDVDATESFTLITAVYQRDKATNALSLYSVGFQDGESAPVLNTTEEGYPKHNSENIMLNFAVPAETDAVTYEVKSFMWSSVSGMEPVSQAFKLTY